MTFEVVKSKTVWCVHYWDMVVYNGELLGTETEEDNRVYIRFNGQPINKIDLIDGDNVFDTEEEAEKALFKAKLGGKKRKPLWRGDTR